MIPKLILLVEDVESDAIVFRLAAQRAGLVGPMYCVASGTEAMSYLIGRGEYNDRQRYPFPAVMFLDLTLPDLKGFDVLAAARNRFRPEELLIFILSASDDPADVRQASLLRADAFLAKPISRASLVSLAEQFPSHFQLPES